MTGFAALKTSIVGVLCLMTQGSWCLTVLGIVPSFPTIQASVRGAVPGVMVVTAVAHGFLSRIAGMSGSGATWAVGGFKLSLLLGLLSLVSVVVVPLPLIS